MTKITTRYIHATFIRCLRVISGDVSGMEPKDYENARRILGCLEEPEAEIMRQALRKVCGAICAGTN